MTTIRVDVTSLIPQVSAQARQNAGRAIAKAARDIEAHAKTLVAVDTGLLKNSIQARQVAPFNWAVESPVDYSVYQEFGTSRTPAHPYMLPALEFVRPKLIAALKSLV